MPFATLHSATRAMASRSTVVPITLWSISAIGCRAAELLARLRTSSPAIGSISTTSPGDTPRTPKSSWSRSTAGSGGRSPTLILCSCSGSNR